MNPDLLIRYILYIVCAQYIPRSSLDLVYHLYLSSQVQGILESAQIYLPIMVPTIKATPLKRPSLEGRKGKES